MDGPRYLVVVGGGGRGGWGNGKGDSSRNRVDGNEAVITTADNDQKDNITMQLNNSNNHSSG